MAHRFFSSMALLAGLAAGGIIGSAHAASDMETCADERVKTAILPLAQLSAAEAACGRILTTRTSEADRQKAAFYRGLMRFLTIVQKGMEMKPAGDGTPAAYAPPSLHQVRPALDDVEAAIGMEGPLKAEALSLRVTIHQTAGLHADARADLDQATRAAPDNPTPLVQRALEHERAGDVNAALADLNAAIARDPELGTALISRAELLRRLGFLARARKDYAAAAALGPPFRRLALMRKSEVELRAGDLRGAYDDLLAAAREKADMPKAEAAAANAGLLVRAGDLALDKLKAPDAAEKHYREAARLAPRDWNAALGLARMEEQRGRRDQAAAIYRRILAATKSTPKLLEHILASYRLKRLSQPLLRDAKGPFRSALEDGVTVGQAAPDGLKRVAFIIGASDYTELASLPNAGRDAVVMANALADMGFDTVEIAENPGKADLRAIPELIGARAAEADIALVFYAGHGVETGGANYLIPVDAVPDSDSVLKTDALALSDLTAAAARARRGALVIVDACRDDPFVEAQTVAASRSLGALPERNVPDRVHAGLAPPPIPVSNTVIFHSTQSGQAALDGDGLDSPFVRALLETLTEPGQGLGEVVRQTVTRVSEGTGGRQVPAAYGAAPAVALLPGVKAR